MIKNIFVFIAVILTSFSVKAKADVFDLVSASSKIEIVYAKDDRKLSQIAAELLATDIERVTGYLPKVSTDLSKASGNVILIGSIKSAIIRSADQDAANALKGKWECYSYKLRKKINKRIKNMLIIAGSDSRGTAYGVFGISEKIGVNPWYWWADVHPQKRGVLSVEIEDFTSKTPSVQYRGIFINDEDWGLQPWAAKTFEPETGDIGPKTYARVFELLLRLKANLIWPAMHPSTKAFYYYPENKQVAADYDIVVSTSHAEPMLRNNVDEWDKESQGAFNYVTNKAKVLNYWDSRVKESAVNEVIYTMGMRGVHDGKMEGVKTTKEAVPLLEEIFADQRDLLKKHVSANVEAIPKALTVYKEVLDIYEAGLKVPEDITLVWPDDNYGYIHRLANDKEASRKGGTGVYYHASYWGRPHDYLWLSTTHPALIREEMTKAYELNARKIWVLNVGDIKPAEYDIQLFLDMAYDIDPFKQSSYTKKHLYQWAADLFGEGNVGQLSDVLWKYYDLAFERRPEFMGWSQTEPTTQVGLTQYKHHLYGDEAQRRISDYDDLQQEANAIAAQISPERRDAFYQLVSYPVKGASLMNRKYLYRDKAILYAGQGRISALAYEQLANSSHEDIIKENNFYNQSLAGGKWNGIMSMNPRNLPVFNAPKLDLKLKSSTDVFGLMPEGVGNSEAMVGESRSLALPPFDPYVTKRHFIDVFLKKAETTEVRLIPSDNWISVSETSFALSPEGLQSEKRVWVEIDWNKVPENVLQLRGSITAKGKSSSYIITVRANNSKLPEGFSGAVESGRYIAINAANYSREGNRTGAKQWEITQGMGTESMVEAMPLTAKADASEAAVIKNPYLEYDFYNFNASAAQINVYTLPTFPLNNDYEMRYAVQVDDLPIEMVNFKTVGRTNEWKNNVLSNNAIKSVSVPQLSPGKHRLRIYMVDPGVILDKIFINLDKKELPYGDVKETRVGGD